MNMAYNLYQDQELDQDGRSVNANKEKLTHRTRRSTYRTRKTPQSFNGMHRRRNKKFAW